MVLCSTVSLLSPVVDLDSASVKTISNRIESGSGKEDRFGRKDQILELYPVYKFTVAGNGGTAVTSNQTVTGDTSKASGTIARVNGSEIYVRVKTSQFFQKG